MTTKERNNRVDYGARIQSRVDQRKCWSVVTVHDMEMEIGSTSLQGSLGLVGQCSHVAVQYRWSDHDGSIVMWWT